MNRNKSFITYLIVLSGTTISYCSLAQEVLVPLKYNSAIKQELKMRAQKNPESWKAGPTWCDTLLLPFVDDFSAPGIYPDYCKWSDSNVFINSDFADTPPTRGVATFDGVDSLGNPYNPSVSSHGPSDTLTSLPIDLYFPGDTTVWLSFYVQPQGMGYAPAGNDSLVLQFHGSDGAWHRIWNKPGQNDSAFAQKMIQIDSSLYLYRGFRFRFINYAALCGIGDIWNLDYVRLDTNRWAGDTVIHNDVAFVSRTLSVLNNYQSVPYPHYKNDTIAAMGTQSAAKIRNLDSIPAVPNHDLLFLRDDFSVDTSFGNVPVSLAAYGSTNLVRNISPFTFPSIAGQDSLLYYAQHILSPSDNNPYNDTLTARQELYNYYAYDDGTAEIGYGLQGQGAELAYRFDLLMPDTLRAVQMRFVHVDYDISMHLFNIMLWKTLTPETGETFLSFSQHAYYEDSINEFHTYILENPVPVSDSIYIGWHQIDPDMLRLGLDRNIISTPKMFFNTSGTWQPSVYQGSLMIRPVFGNDIASPASVGNESRSENSFSVYPVPASDRLVIRNNSETNRKYFFRICDILGRNILHGQLSGTPLDVSALGNGMYQLIISDNTLRSVSSRRIIISR